MRTAQIVYNVVALLFVGFFVVSALGVYFIVMPSSEPDGRGIWYFTLSLEAIIILGLALGALANFINSRLLTIPTLVTIVCFAISLYLIPLAIWGIFLLLYELKRVRAAQEAALRQ